MPTESRLRPHFESAQRGLVNLNLESWYQLVDFLDSAGRISEKPHTLFAAKIIFQCRSILSDVDEVKWEEVRWKSEAGAMGASLAELLEYLEIDNFEKTCQTLNRMVQEAYRLKIIAASMPPKESRQQI